MNEMITISRAEYDRLRAAAEDLEDLQAYGRAIAAGGVSRPAASVHRLINGENALLVYRDFRGLTRTALAAKSGVNRVQIADIEARRGNGSVETMRKLADALGVTIDDLV